MVPPASLAIVRAIVRALRPGTALVDVGCGQVLNGYWLLWAARARPDCRFLGTEIGAPSVIDVQHNLQVIRMPRERALADPVPRQFCPAKVCVVTAFGVNLTPAVARGIVQALSPGGVFVTWYRGDASEHLEHVRARGLAVAQHPEDPELHVGHFAGPVLGLARSQK